MFICFFPWHLNEEAQTFIGTFPIFSHTLLMLSVSLKAQFQVHPTHSTWHVFMLFLFGFSLSFDTSPSLHKLFRSVLVNIQVFGVFLGIFLLLVSTLIPWGSKTIFQMISILLTWLRLSYDQGHEPPWQLFQMRLRTMCLPCWTERWLLTSRFGPVGWRSRPVLLHPGRGAAPWLHRFWRRVRSACRWRRCIWLPFRFRRSRLWSSGHA